MMCDLTVTQFDNWYFYSQLEPFGFPLQDYIQAQLSSTLLNASGRFSEPFKVSDFLLSEMQIDPEENTTEDVKEQDWKTLKEKMSRG